MGLGEYMKRIVIILLSISLNVFLFSINVYADNGPKPSINIIAENMPEEICYMDLLINYSDVDNFDNLDDISKYNRDMFNTLKEYKDEDWRPAIATGTRVPLHGDIICDVDNGISHLQYSYVGVPDYFKIIVVTESNQIVVSNAIERKAFQSTVYFDFEKGTAYEKSLIVSYLLQFIMTFIPTILIEGLLLLAFGFSIRRNYKPFIFINGLTQVLLTVVVLVSMLTDGTLIGLIRYFLFELVIIAIEIVLFSKFLLGHNKMRKTVYALVANVVSFMVGIIILLYS